MIKKRRVCYVTGTRADFGLMQSTLQAIRDHASMELALVVTGMHLSAAHGNTMNDIVVAGLPISATVSVDLCSATGATMARNIGIMLQGFVDAFQKLEPDVVLLLGDRGEMLAGALAAIHLNIPVAHIHGGERSGTVDEPIRHAISKLSHIHFTATQEARSRLVRMGEDPANIIVTGAPGLDGLKELATSPKQALCKEAGFDPDKRTALLVFHPVLQEADLARGHTEAIMHAMLDEDLQVMALLPNSDAGSDEVRRVLEKFYPHPKVRVLSHLPRSQFVSWMAVCDVMVGNSSSGIIEAATFGTPVINIGVRQNLRQRNKNVIEAEPDKAKLRTTIARTLVQGRFAPENCYGDGHAAKRISEYLATFPLNGALLLKCNTY